MICPNCDRDEMHVGIVVMVNGLEEVMRRCGICGYVEEASLTEEDRYRVEHGEL